MKMKVTRTEVFETSYGKFETLEAAKRRLRFEKLFWIFLDSEELSRNVSKREHIGAFCRHILDNKDKIAEAIFEDIEVV